MHYGFGILTGAAYGAIAEDWDGFGAAVWLASDEAAAPALQLSKPPTSYPPRVHAMALGPDLVYGLTTEWIRRALRGRPARRRW